MLSMAFTSSDRLGGSEQPPDTVACVGPAHPKGRPTPAQPDGERKIQTSPLGLCVIQSSAVQQNYNPSHILQL